MRCGWARIAAAVVAACALGLSAQAQPQPQAQAQPPQGPPKPPVGEMKSLGQDRYQVGRIVVDKRAGTVTVPGRVLVLDKPLEYLATSPGGRKAYEALLELDASGTELNLACILVGLERDPDVPSWRPLGVAGRTGSKVNLWLTWTDGGRQRRLTAAEALGAEAGSLEWAYTGSFTSKDGSQLAADVTGSLISFVKKDQSGVIEVVSDSRLGPYGSIRGNAALPPVGSPIDLVLQAAPAAR